AITMAAMARAPAPPQGVEIQGEVAYDTTVSWKAVQGAAGYRVWWRETTAPRWEHARDAGNATSLKLAGINIDDYYFGVSAVSADGWESPVVFPGFSGSFDRSPGAVAAD
ncbi:MAG TPA: fibronectin type III domain-containing protein, partial [Luteimonas sp.]|nr:fibronectin type III domain-containing protein [Luteimonas sp.]